MKKSVEGLFVWFRMEIPELSEIPNLILMWFSETSKNSSRRLSSAYWGDGMGWDGQDGTGLLCYNEAVQREHICCHFPVK